MLGASSLGATLYLNDVSPSANMTVTFPGLSAETTPYVGHINWTFDRGNSDNATLDTLVQGSSLTTFCIEGTQNVYIHENSTFSSILTGVIGAPKDHVGSVYAMDATDAATLSMFWDAHYSQSLLSNTDAAAFQLGMWEIVYDGGTSPNFTAGNFKASAVAGDTTSAAALAEAQSWLSGLPNVTPTEHYQLYVLSDRCLQDQVFGVNAVPLPAALPAGLSLLAGLGVFRRYRKRPS